MTGETTLWQVLAICCLPVLGNAIGVLLAEITKPPKWLIGALLHGAAGIAIALVVFDLIPEAKKSENNFAIAIAAFIGAIGSLGFAWATSKLTSSLKGRTGAWMVYTAIGADLVSDGLMTGAGSASSFQLGLLLSGAQLVANVPGGYAAGANLASQKVRRKQRLLVGVLVSLPIFVSAMLGYLALRGAPDWIQGLAIAAIVGLLLTATIEDLIPEGDAPRPPRWASTAAFAAGFSGFVLLSTSLGS